MDKGAEEMKYLYNFLISDHSKRGNLKKLLDEENIPSCFVREILGCLRREHETLVFSKKFMTFVHNTDLLKFNQGVDEYWQCRDIGFDSEFYVLEINYEPHFTLHKVEKEEI